MRSTRPAGRQFGICQALDAHGADAAQRGGAAAAGGVLGGLIAGGADGAVGLREILLTARGIGIPFRHHGVPDRAGTGRNCRLPCCHAGLPVGRPGPQAVLDLLRPPQDVGAAHRFLSRVDHGLGLVVAVDEGEQLIVFALRDRIVLVIVALGALNGQAQHGLADGFHAIEQGFRAELLGVDAAFFVEQAVAEESGGHSRRLAGIRQQVAGQLFCQEAIVRQVPVEGIDHPVAIEMRDARLVLLEPVAVRITGRVQPVPPPAFAEMRARQQGVDGTPERIGRPIVHEGIDRRGRGRQSDQVEMQPPQQRDAIRFRCRRQAFGRQSRPHKGIDRVLGVRRHCGQRRADRRAKRPVRQLRRVLMRLRRHRGHRGCSCQDAGD